MNKNKYVNLFLGMLIGVLLTNAVMSWISVEAVINGGLAVLGLIFAIYYNQL